MHKCSGLFLAVVLVAVELLEVVELLLLLLLVLLLVGGRHPVCGGGGGRGGRGVAEHSLLGRAAPHLHRVRRVHVARASDLGVLANWEPVGVHTPPES